MLNQYRVFTLGTHIWVLIVDFVTFLAFPFYRIPAKQPHNGLFWNKYLNLNLITTGMSDRRELWNVYMLAIFILAIGVILFVGASILSRIVEQTALSSDDPFYQTYEVLKIGFNNKFTLLGIVVVLIIGAIPFLHSIGNQPR
mgnify:CR=1 FL=1